MISGIIVVCIAVFFDALRDGHIDCNNWWKRHIFKWLAFFPPIVYILFVCKMQILHVAILIPVCWLLWQIGLRLSGKTWESMWIRLIKKVLEFFE